MAYPPLLGKRVLMLNRFSFFFENTKVVFAALSVRYSEDH